MGINTSCRLQGLSSHHTPSSKGPTGAFAGLHLKARHELLHHFQHGCILGLARQDFVDQHVAFMQRKSKVWRCIPGFGLDVLKPSSFKTRCEARNIGWAQSLVLPLIELEKGLQRIGLVVRVGLENMPRVHIHFVPLQVPTGF